MWPACNRVNDFYQDWGSARNYLVSLPVYTHHVISISRHLHLTSNPVPSIEYNAHPPTSVLLALPLARLNYSDAVLVWNIITVVAFLAAMIIVVRELSVPPRYLLPILAILAFCHPIYGNIYQSQLTLPLLFLVTAIWALERSNWLRAAGLLLGIAAAIKLFPAYLAVYYIARRRWQTVLAAVLSFLALTLVTAFLLGADTYYDYISVVLPNQTKFRSFTYNLSIAGFWHKLFDPVADTGPVEPLCFNPTLARWGTLVSSLAVSAIVAVQAYLARTAAQRDLAFSAAITAMLLVSPVTWDFSLPLLLVPIATITQRAWIERAHCVIAALLTTLIIDWIPQNLLTQLCQESPSESMLSWTFTLRAASLKFYSLIIIIYICISLFRRDIRNVIGKIV
jgi:Glycosyltransferase family 87